MELKRKKIVDINENEGQFLENIGKFNKTLARVIRKTDGLSYRIINEKGSTVTDPVMGKE